MIFELSSGEFVGHTIFFETEMNALEEIEIGYAFRRKFWGQGFATEALSAVINWSKNNIETKYIIAIPMKENKSSHRVLIKCGMEYYRDQITEGIDCCVYRIKLNSLPSHE